jgi:hypothetical protein
MTSTLNATIDLHRVSMVDRLSDPLVIGRMLDSICKLCEFTVTARHHVAVVAADTHTFVVAANVATITLSTFPSRAYAIFHIHTFEPLDHALIDKIHHFLASAFGARRVAEYMNITESFFAPGVSDALDAYAQFGCTAPIPIPLPVIPNPFEDESSIQD